MRLEETTQIAEDFVSDSNNTVNSNKAMTNRTDRVMPDLVMLGKTGHDQPSSNAEPDAELPESKLKRIRKRPPESGDPFNEVETTIFERRSVRVFKTKQLPDHLVNRILEAGRFAPSAGNCQSWKFVVVQDQKMIQEMTDRVVKLARWTSRLMNPSFPKAIAGNWFSRLMMRLFTGIFHPTGVTGLGQLAQGELGLWHGAPTIIFLLVDERGTGDPHLDIGIVGTNMVLTAHSFGLGTCWVSFSTLLEMSPKFKKYLGIAYPYRLATSIAVGYPKGIPDGMVTRETHETVWYDDNGVRKTVY